MLRKMLQGMLGQKQHCTWDCQNEKEIRWAGMEYLQVDIVFLMHAKMIEFDNWLVWILLTCRRYGQVKRLKRPTDSDKASVLAAYLGKSMRLSNDTELKKENWKLWLLTATVTVSKHLENVNCILLSHIPWKTYHSF